MKRSLSGVWYWVIAAWQRRPTPIADALWQSTLGAYPFLAALTVREQTRLRDLSQQFLARKEFCGAQGLVVTDAMAVAIAVQACVPLMNLAEPAIRHYDGFTGIVVHPGVMLARREVTDAAGVVHRYSEELIGEAMDGGPVTLSWHDVEAAGASAEMGQNVVIHEFIHTLDMRDGAANGCPPLSSRAARAQWHEVMQSAYDSFCELVAKAERFGGEPPWLDDYAATDPAEFFAVTGEAYFVNRPRFAQDFAELTLLYDAYFNPDSRAMR